MKTINQTTGHVLRGQSPDELLSRPIDEIRDLFRSHGAVQFLGFSFSPLQFTDYTEKFGGKFLPYIVGAYTREPVNDDHTLVKVNSGEVAISLHGEQHYKKNQADLIWFYCEVPPSEGGATLICDGVEIYRQLSPETQKFLSEHKVKYTRWMAHGFWQKVFNTDVAAKMRLMCEYEGLTVKLHDNNSVSTEFVASPIVQTSFGHGHAFINNILVVLLDQIHLPAIATALTISEVTMEDGRPIPTEIVEEVRSVSSQLTHAVNWRSGDFILLDNKRFMHGRESFYGQKQRRVLTRMAKLL